MIDDVYRPTSFETSVGFLFGLSPGSSRPPRPTGSPRRLIESSVRECLLRVPCIVSFSGGRDSSALLAVAADIARREGLPLPVPVTDVFRSVPDAEESDWQELVIRHLELPDWVRRYVDDEHDAVGPLAIPVLRRFGLVYPALSYDMLPTLEMARGGTLVTGDGGDEVMGAKRISIAVYAARERLRLPRPDLTCAAEAVAPRPIRAIVARRRRPAASHRWLLPKTARLLIQEMVKSETGEPLDWRLATWRKTRERSTVEGTRTLRRLAQSQDVTLVHPFLDPGFVASFAHSGGRLGHASRSSGMGFLFGDLLPETILCRRSKASFNGAVFAGHTRAFAESWSGSGVPHDLVDAGRLREEWLSDTPHAGTLLLLQQAWLATATASTAS